MTPFLPVREPAVFWISKNVQRDVKMTTLDGQVPCRGVETNFIEPRPPDRRAPDLFFHCNSVNKRTNTNVESIAKRELPAQGGRTGKLLVEEQKIGTKGEIRSYPQMMKISSAAACDLSPSSVSTFRLEGSLDVGVADAVLNSPSYCS